MPGAVAIAPTPAPSPTRTSSSPTPATSTRPPSPAIPARAPSPPRLTAQPAPADAAASRVPIGAGSGQPLAEDVRARLEKGFGGANLGQVRVHTGDGAARLARKANARAFATGHHIVLGAGESPRDIPLLAHEVAHVLQQGASGRVHKYSAGSSGDAHESEAQRASSIVAQGGTVAIAPSASAPAVQRLGLSDALDYFADKANAIPGFRMFTIVLGVNPINMSRVERTAANILRAVVEFIPGGTLISQALDNHGIFDRVGTWVEQQISALGMTGSSIRQAIDRFLDSLSWSDIFDLGGVWSRAKRIFSDPIDRIFTTVRNFATGIIKFIKDAILRPLAALAEGTRAYPLLKAVLGQDPITGEPVPRNAETLIGGFMILIGQEEVWKNLQQARAVPRAWAWFQGALQGLLAFVRQIPGLFVQAFQSLELMDIVLVPRAFLKIGKVFGGFVGQFLSWGLAQVISLLQIIFEVLAPAVMPYIRKAASAFRTIVSNPIGFIGNLVRAGIQGFRQFAGNFLTHLKTSLIGWLTGTLAGANIYIPQGLSFIEIIKFVLSVLGLTWQNIRQKLVKHVGETTVKVLETGFDIVVTLVREGPAAAWEKIKEQLSNLKEMVMEQIMSFVATRIVQAAITKLVTSLNPAGAFIQAVIAIYNTIMFLVERLRQIAQVVASFIDAIAAIASGIIKPAADRVERTMGGMLTLVISFLARLVGLGRVSDAVKNIVDKIRAPIDRALDKVVEWIVTQVKRLGSAIAGGAKKAVAAVLNWWKASRGFTGPDGKPHTVSVDRQGKRPVITVRSKEQSLEQVIAALPAGEKRSKLEARFSEIKTLMAGTEPEVAKQEERHKQLQEKVDALAAELGTSKARPSVVSNSTTSSNRAFRIIADPLTSRPGNTAGSAASGDIVERSLFWAYVQPKPEERTIKGRRVTLETLSMIHGTHTLSERLHGPADRWNIVNASRSANMNMKKPELDADKLVKKGFELKYTTTVAYHSDTAPPAIATQPTTLAGLSDDSARQSKVREWLGFYFARSLKVSLAIVSRPVGGESETVPNYPEAVSDIQTLPLRLGPPPPSLEERVYAAAVASAGTGGQVGKVKSIAATLGVDNSTVSPALDALAASGRLTKKGRFWYVAAKPVVEEA